MCYPAARPVRALAQSCVYYCVTWRAVGRVCWQLLGRPQPGAQALTVVASAARWQPSRKISGKGNRRGSYASFFRKRFCSSGASDFPRSIACSVSDWSSGVYIYKYSAWAATCAADGRGVGAREQLVHHHDMLLSHRGRTWRDSEAARLCSGVGAASLTDRASDCRGEFKAC